MFSLKWPATGVQPAPSTIQEANKHMQAMVARIQELEQRAKEQSELLNRRELEHQAHLDRIRREQHIAQQNADGDVATLTDNVRLLEEAVKDRERQIAFLLHRTSFLDEAASYAPLLEQLSTCLKTAFNSPQAKVQTVKPTRTAQNVQYNNQAQTVATPHQQNGDIPRTTATSNSVSVRVPVQPPAQSHQQQVTNGNVRPVYQQPPVIPTKNLPTDMKKPVIITPH